MAGRLRSFKEGTEHFEVFCQALVRGRSMTAAAVEIGYEVGKSASMAGPRLAKREDVKARVAEIQTQMREDIRRTVLLRMPTREDVLRDLIESREEARKAGALSVRIKANELIGKEIGMFVTRVDAEVRGVSVLDSVDRTTLLAFLDLVRSARTIDGEFIDLPEQNEAKAQPTIADETDGGDDDPMR